MKCTIHTALAIVIALSGCGRVGYVGGGVDGGDDGEAPVTDAASRHDGTHHPDDTGPAKTDGHADTGHTRDSATDTGGHDAAAEAARDAAGTDSGDSTAPSDALADVGIGCMSPADCPAEMACDPTTHTCTSACSPSQPCNSCCGASGTCIPGTAGDVECVTLEIGDAGPPGCEPAAACAECAGPYVCGDGVSYGTVVNTSYACNAGTLAATGMACAFGCDSTTGHCKDMVAANAASMNLATGDHFTCTGSQSTSLPSISAGSGDVILFDTGTASVTKNGGSAIAALWGAPYTPSGGGTTLIVAHIHGLSVGPGATVTITGANALVLLVDLDVSISGTSVAPTLIDLSAHYSSVPTPLAGPGANKTGTGGGGTSLNQSGGGGGGHGVAGGAGGGSGTPPMLVAGGVAFGNPFLLEAGASGGGLTSDRVGKGGGGLQVSTCRDISVGDGVLVNASGGGGMAAVFVMGGQGTPTGGYGGGSGGTILLEGATANSLVGSIVANGGGGGAGGTANSPTTAQNGSDWPTSGPYYGVAPGGGVAAALGSGGAGGAGTTAPGNGSNAPAGNGGGAGGGAYGAIFIGVSPVAAMPTATAASPPAYYSKTCTTVGGIVPTTCSY